MTAWTVAYLFVAKKRLTEELSSQSCVKER
jgi:hypothetical protein